MVTKKTEEGLGVQEHELSSIWHTATKISTDVAKKFIGWANQLGASDFCQSLGKGIVSALKWAKDLATKTFQGGKTLLEELGKAFQTGDWNFLGDVFENWRTESPLTLMAGGAAAGISAAAVLYFGGQAIGWVGAATIGRLVSSLGVWRAGLSVAGILGGLTAVGTFLYNFEWQETDAQIDQDIDKKLTSLYSPLGEFLGRSLAYGIVGGLTGKPKVNINITNLAIAWEFNEGIREQLLDAVSDLARVGVQGFAVIAVKLAYKNARHWLKQRTKDNKELFIKTFGEDAYGAVVNWGEPGSKPWSIKRWLGIQEKIESIEDEKIRNLAEEATESFWESWRESIVISKSALA